MLQRLNGWQRIGVIVSLFWTCPIVIFAISEYAVEPRSGGYFYVQVHTQSKSHRLSTPETLAAERPKRTLSVGEVLSQPPPRYHFRFSVFAALLILPPLLLWLSAYAVVGAVRWVIAGFKRNAP